jgi:CubicO group peptidase (beta-lactamase class C family)
MIKNTILLVLLGCSLISRSQDLTARLDTLLQAYTSLYKFNGTVLVAKNGTLLLDKGYGYRNVAAGTPHDKNSIFQIGSVTKQFTMTIILTLQSAGKLNIQDPISKYFPQYPHGDSITIEQLLSHTSGIYNYTNDRAFMQNEVSKPSNRDKMIALFKDKPLDFAPGTKYQYSNSGYLLLGYIIESVTKKSYEQVVREYIFTPLKMTNSGFDFTHLQNKGKSTGYFAFNKKDTTASPIVDSSVSFAAGAIYSTTQDMYRWHQALENNVILTNAQQEKAYSPVKSNYGYGWEIDSMYGKRVVSHAGGIHGFTSKFSRIPADDVCIILLCNTSNPFLNNITTGIYSILYNKPYEIPKQRNIISISEEKLKQYTGVYTINEKTALSITLKGSELTAAPNNDRPVVLHPEKEDYFFVEMPDVQLLFTRNENQEVNGLILYQNGQEKKCPKIK